MLDLFGCVDYLCFGCENPELFKNPCLFDGQIYELDAFKSTLKSKLKSGENFASARAAAISNAVLSPSADGDEEYLDFKAKLEQALKNPNNILGLEYVNAINDLDSDIKPAPMKREGDDYDSMTIQSDTPSSTAIRNILLSEYPSYIYSETGKYMPEEICRIVSDYNKKSVFLKQDDFSSLLSYSILLHYDELDIYLDGSKELADRLRNIFKVNMSWSELSAALKTKNYTLTRVNRYLTHILLGIKEKTFETAKKQGIIFYAHQLGLNTKSSACIAYLKEHSKIPIHNSIVEIRNILYDRDEKKQLELRLERPATAVNIEGDTIILNRNRKPPIFATPELLAISMLECDMIFSEIYHLAQNGKALFGPDVTESGVFIH